MKYPSYRISYGPTPSETLMICDKCQTGTWEEHPNGGYSKGVRVCNSCRGRKRISTVIEKQIALTYLIPENCIGYKIK